MHMLKLAAAAAIAFGTMGALSVPTPEAKAEAQRGSWYEGGRRHWRGDGHRHGWRAHRGRHYGWRNRRVCRWVWRHGHRARVCRSVRYRWR